MSHGAAYGAQLLPLSLVDNCEVCQQRLFVDLAQSIAGKGWDQVQVLWNLICCHAIPTPGPQIHQCQVPSIVRHCHRGHPLPPLRVGFSNDSHLMSSRGEAETTTKEGTSPLHLDMLLASESRAIDCRLKYRAPPFPAPTTHEWKMAYKLKVNLNEAPNEHTQLSTSTPHPKASNLLSWISCGKGGCWVHRIWPV